MRRCKNTDISSVFSSQKTSIALIHLKPSLAGSVSDLCVPVVGSRDQNVCVTYGTGGWKLCALPTPHRAERYREWSWSKKKEDTRKTATHIIPPEILDDAPRTLLRPSKPLLFLPSSRPFHLFSMYFTNAWLSADVLFCPRRRTTRRERDCITAARSFAKLRRMPRGNRRETLLFMENW